MKLYQEQLEQQPSIDNTPINQEEQQPEAEGSAEWISDTTNELKGIGEDISEGQLNKLGTDQLKSEIINSSKPTSSIYIKDNFVYLTKGQDVQKIPVEQYYQEKLGIQMPNSDIAKKAQLAFEVAGMWKNTAFNLYPKLNENPTGIEDNKIASVRSSIKKIDQTIQLLQSEIPVPSNDALDRATNTIKNILVECEAQSSVVGIKDVQTMFDKIYHDDKSDAHYEDTRVNILNLFRKSSIDDHLWFNDNRGGNSTLVQATFGGELIQTPEFTHVKSLFDNQKFVDAIKAGNFDTSNDPALVSLFDNLGGSYEFKQLQDIFKKIRINGPKQGLTNDQITLNFINTAQLYLIGKQLERNPSLRQTPKGKAYREASRNDQWLDKLVTIGKELAIQGVCLFVSGGIANLAVKTVQGAVWLGRAARAGQTVGQYLNTAGRGVKALDFIGSVALEGTLFQGLHTLADSGVRAMLGEEYHLRDELKDGKGYAKSIAFMGVLKAFHGLLGKLTSRVNARGDIVTKDWYQSFANPKNPIGKLFFKQAAEKGIQTNILGSAIKFTGEGILLTATGVTVDVMFGDRNFSEWTWEELIQGILLSYMLSKANQNVGKLMIKRGSDGTISVSQAIERVKEKTGAEFTPEQVQKIEQFSKVKKIKGRELEQQLKRQIENAKQNSTQDGVDQITLSRILGNKYDFSDFVAIKEKLDAIHDRRRNATPEEKALMYRDKTGDAGDLYNLTPAEIKATLKELQSLTLKNGQKLTKEEIIKLMDEGVLGSIGNSIEGAYKAYKKGEKGTLTDQEIILLKNKIEEIKKEKKQNSGAKKPEDISVKQAGYFDKLQSIYVKEQTRVDREELSRLDGELDTELAKTQPDDSKVELIHKQITDHYKNMEQNLTVEKATKDKINDITLKIQDFNKKDAQGTFDAKTDLLYKEILDRIPTTGSVTMTTIENKIGSGKTKPEIIKEFFKQIQKSPEFTRSFEETDSSFGTDKYGGKAKVNEKFEQLKLFFDGLTSEKIGGKLKDELKTQVQGGGDIESNYKQYLTVWLKNSMRSKYENLQKKMEQANNETDPILKDQYKKEAETIWNEIEGDFTGNYQNTSKAWGNNQGEFNLMKEKYDAFTKPEKKIADIITSIEQRKKNLNKKRIVTKDEFIDNFSESRSELYKIYDSTTIPSVEQVQKINDIMDGYQKYYQEKIVKNGDYGFEKKLWESFIDGTVGGTNLANKIISKGNAIDPRIISKVKDINSLFPGGGGDIFITEKDIRFLALKDKDPNLIAKMTINGKTDWLSGFIPSLQKELMDLKGWKSILQRGLVNERRQNRTIAGLDSIMMISSPSAAFLNYFVFSNILGFASNSLVSRVIISILYHYGIKNLFAGILDIDSIQGPIEKMQHRVDSVFFTIVQPGKRFDDSSSSTDQNNNSNNSGSNNNNSNNNSNNGGNQNNNSNNSNNNGSNSNNNGGSNAAPETNVEKWDEMNEHEVKKIIYNTDSNADIDAIYNALTDQQKLQIFKTGTYQL